MNRQIQKDASVVTMVHEMREPVQAIRGFLSILLAGRAGNLTESQRDFLATANRAAGRLSRLIDDLELLQYSSASTVTLVPAQVDLIERVDACIAELQPVAANLSMPIEVHVEGDTDLVIPGDPGRIDQILLNLIENALKYGAESTSVHVKLRGSKSRVLCVVENTVPSNVDRENPHDWFKPYIRQCKPFERSSLNGYGLGLTVVDMLVKAHFGNILSRVEGDCVSIGFVLPRHSPLLQHESIDHVPDQWVAGDDLLRMAC